MKIIVLKIKILYFEKNNFSYKVLKFSCTTFKTNLRTFMNIELNEYMTSVKFEFYKTLG